MKILFIGNREKHGYSFYQYKILKKIYKTVEILEIKNLNKTLSFINSIIWKYNNSIFDHMIMLKLKSTIKKNYDLIYVHNESLLGNKSIIFLKTKAKKIFYYCPDNPFVARDNKRWELIKNNFNLFDLIIFMQKNRFRYAKKLGLNKTIWIPPTFKIKEQKRLKNNYQDYKKYSSDVVLIATCFPEREKLIEKLIKEKINIKIYGDRWNKSNLFGKYKNYFGSKISNDLLYVKLIQYSKIAICLPSYENDDDITNRSLEIPYIGTFLLAKKTKTHQETFVNNKEAVLFNNFNDCVKKINYFLRNKKQRIQIAKNGQKKILQNKKYFSFEENIKKIISNYLI